MEYSLEYRINTCFQWLIHVERCRLFCNLVKYSTAMNATELDDRISLMEKNAISKKIERIYGKQQAFFRSGVTRPLAFRKQQLQRLILAIEKNKALLVEALYKDLRKSEFEVYGTELEPVLAEARFAVRHLREWMQPRKVPTPLLFFPSRSEIIRDPLGVVLTLGPWNYPFLLAMSPLINAIAGGNTIMLKPSDIAVHTGDVIEKIITEYFDEEFVAVIQGPGEIAGTELIGKYHFDHIFFTGSERVGKMVMEMAAKHLSPVTLELGGKSPCIVDKDVNLSYAAKKIAWSKTLNAGQTCVAPDYVLVHESVKEQLIENLKKEFIRMFGPDPQKSPDYPRLIHEGRLNKMKEYLGQGRIVFGGQTDVNDLYVAPAILTDVKEDDSVMREEIFGPVLPVISFKDTSEILQWIEKNPYPLSLYVYTNSRAFANIFTDQVRFGGGCVNNGVIHLGNPHLPFGGAGHSGMGQYHGRFGFETFTRPKSIMRSTPWFDVPLWYAPYKGHLKWLKFFFRL